ncbi:methyltransferase domain-containing protein [Micromonospora sp. 4G57]|uniref:Methyltransferase domain-containing protein n=1 Tax=Micromonospora sicca TaxID=2202420 RepID=A0ABU5JFJ9_9ACTN|nr:MULTISPECIES: methyltransferase domain-containing protein [unclassified Micromonospora]MDZ5445372.1 methyltransferase domain-containing protein [Micromonospora sp. 4G57]MDZ5491219.1 methyltransferase domain-containing protein [Micromonospora sp. 4G53]
MSSRSVAAGDPTGWFERLYAEAERGEAVVPWDRDTPHSLLAEWTGRTGMDGAGRSAVVVGCGFGRGAEHLAGLGFRTVAFEISPTAVRAARARHPDSPVRYQTADLLDPPTGWQPGFDLVLESMTVQALPVELRERAGRGGRQGGTYVQRCQESRRPRRPWRRGCGAARAGWPVRPPWYAPGTRR